MLISKWAATIPPDMALYEDTAQPHHDAPDNEIFPLNTKTSNEKKIQIKRRRFLFYL